MKPPSLTEHRPPKAITIPNPSLSLRKLIALPLASALGGALLGHSLLSEPPATAIYSKANPSVVTVSSMGIQRDPFSPKLTEAMNGQGTGFSFIGDQYIITNAHVVEDAFSVKVTDTDHHDFEATVLGKDPFHDIALLQIPKSAIKPLLKCSAAPSVGEKVLAIGTPFGLEHTLTAGIVSGIDRSIGAGEGSERPPLVSLIQTDAAINPGNSGGPLLDAKSGCVLGVNTAMLSASGSSSGVGFAMPISMVQRIADGILQDAPYEKVQLGVTIVQDSVAKFLGIEGAIISSVIPGGHADQLGLVGTSRDEWGRPMIGDVILAIDGKPIHNGVDLFAALDALSQGDRIVITVLTGSGVQDYDLKL